MQKKVILIDESVVDDTIEDLFCRLDLNDSRLQENDGKINNYIINNLNICIGMFKALQLLDLVDKATEESYKKYLDLFY